MIKIEIITKKHLVTHSYRESAGAILDGNIK